MFRSISYTARATHSIRTFGPRLSVKLFALLAMLFAAIAIPSAAQDQVHRLILKDGSYQLCTKYEVKKGRVRYYSSEREEWEELPDSLVDWKATDAYEKDRAARDAAPEAVELDKEAAEEERQAEEAEKRLPEVAPGLRLPEDSGVFLLDSFNGEPQLDEVQQTAGEVNRNTKSNILRGAINPIAGLKRTVEIDGAHAAVQSHVGVPSLYINVDTQPDQPSTTKSTASNSTASKSTNTSANANDGPEQPEQPQQAEQAVVPYDRFILVHAEVKNNKRVISEIKRELTGKVAEEHSAVKTTIDKVAAGWLKLTPTEPLAPGEYALVELGPEGMNLFVWDFGVNPKAAANANPWKPEVKDAMPAAPSDAKTPPAPTPPAPTSAPAKPNL
jgi:hypothetical protein